MDKIKIDNDLIKYLRINTGITNFALDETEPDEIIPKSLTHENLLSNFVIDGSIWKYYHLPTSNLLTDTEFQQMKETGFAGKKETAFRPYSIKIYGAYHLRSNFVFRLNNLSLTSPTPKIQGNDINYLNDLIPYFKAYAKGFQNGFNEFENLQIRPYLTDFADQKDYFFKVFECITKKLAFNHNWNASLSGFAKNQNGEIVRAFEDGQIQGLYYRAWSIVFSNNHYFAPLFQDLFKDKEYEQDESIEKEPADIPEKFMDSYFKKMFPNNGWRDVFENEEDYLLLDSILKKFLHGEQYQLPEKPIKIKKGTKSKVLAILNSVHKKNTPYGRHLKHDSEFFNIVKVLDQMKDDTNIYDSLNRRSIDNYPK